MRIEILIAIGLTTLTGCPLDDPGFSGTWTYNMGSSVTITCPGRSSTAALAGNEEFRDGTDSDLVLVSRNGCNLKIDLSGDRADVVPGQSCVEIENGVTETTTFNTASYTLQGDMLSFNLAGTVRLLGPGGDVTCTFSGSATLRKVSQ